MPILIVLIATSLMFVATLNNLYVAHINSKKTSFVVIDKATKRLKDIEKISIQYKPQVVRDNPTKAKELIQKILIRTCNNIYQKGTWYKCSDAQKAHTVWKFTGAIGTKGDLDDAWNDSSTTSTFSCGKEKEYGRYIVQNALDKHIVHDGNWSYNLEGVDDNSSYPCGYSEIVFIEK